MRIFGKERETLRVEKVKVSRAIYESAEVQRAEIKLNTEGNTELTLELNPDVLRALILQCTNTYDAMRPPLRHNTSAADWMGME